MSVVAIAAPLFALLGVLLAGVGAAGARWGLLSPLTGFLLFAFAGLLLCGLLALVCGAIGIWRTRLSAHRTGAAQAWAGLLAGVAMLALLFLLAPAGGTPPIHDITTDVDDPPRFSALLRAADNQGRDLAYPHGAQETPSLQRASYPDLQPILVAAPPAATLDRALRAARELGWEVVEVHEIGTESSGATAPVEPGFEAVDVTRVFRFTDDVVVRLRDEGARTRVDVRSTSRVGQSDLGANAARIRALRSALEPPE